MTKKVRAPKGASKAERNTATRPARNRKRAGAESPSPSPSFDGGVAESLLRGNYDAYRAARPHGVTRAEFIQAVAVTAWIRQTLNSAGLRKHQRERLSSMAEIALDVADHDAALAKLLVWCEGLTRWPPRGVPVTADHCALLPTHFALIRPELGAVSAEEIAKLATSARSGRHPAPAVLAAAIWNAAGLRGRGDAPMKNTKVTMAARRAEKRRIEGNEG